MLVGVLFGAAICTNSLKVERAQTHLRAGVSHKGEKNGQQYEWVPCEPGEQYYAWDYCDDD